jgi:tetratricopeptide (TPR) repeat protein
VSSAADDDVLQASTLFEQVLDVAPDYVPAWVGLGFTRLDQVRRLLIPRDEGIALGREALAQALAIDPNNAEAYAMWSFLALTYENDLKAVSDHLNKALLLEPTNDRVLVNASNLLWALGRFDECLSLDKYIVAKDPLNPRYHYNLALDYLWLGQVEKAIAAANFTLTLAPDKWYANFLLTRALLVQGENEAALEAIQKEPAEYLRLIGLAMVYHALGRKADADAAVAEFIEKYAQTWPYHLAAVLAYRGEVDRSFEWLKKGASSDIVEPDYHLFDPMFANNHDDPRWLQFLREIGKSPEQLAAIEFEVHLPH